MKSILPLLILLCSIEGLAQTDDGMASILKFTGSINPEDVDSYEVERLSDFLQSPLCINSSEFPALEKSGLFTTYQAASIIDYRARHGDVLSITELAGIDGFGTESASQIAPFISLESRNPAGRRSGAGRKQVSQELSVRGGYRQDDERSYMYGVKYRLISGQVCVNVGASRKYADRNMSPSELTLAVSLDHKKGKIVLGDFNARFGQGLCLWNSSVIGNLSSPSAFMRKPSGISPSYSFNGTYALTGVAADVYAGKWRVSALLAVPGIKKISMNLDNVMLQPAINMTRIGRHGHISMTHIAAFSDFWNGYENFRIPHMMTSIDAAFCIRGVNLFGETAFDWVNSAIGTVIGTDFKVGDDFRMASLMRFCPPSGFSNEYGMALSGEVCKGRWMKPKGKSGNSRRFVGSFTAEASYYPKSKSKDVSRCVQMKALGNISYMITDSFQVRCRIAGRFRTWGPTWRTDVRLDFAYNSDNGSAAVRLNMLDARKTGYLGYAEGGLNAGSLGLYLRAGAFCVDNWDDRIYVYERDAPGSFNVPALYGRGIWTSLYLSYRPVSCCRLYLRASYIDYPFMDQGKRKPGRAELKMQAVFRI